MKNIAILEAYIYDFIMNLLSQEYSFLLNVIVYSDLISNDFSRTIIDILRWNRPIKTLSDEQRTIIENFVYTIINELSNDEKYKDTISKLEYFITYSLPFSVLSPEERQFIHVNLPEYILMVMIMLDNFKFKSQQEYIDLQTAIFNRLDKALASSNLLN